MAGTASFGMRGLVVAVHAAGNGLIMSSLGSDEAAASSLTTTIQGVAVGVGTGFLAQGAHVFIGYNNNQVATTQVQTSIIENGGSCTILNINVSDEDSIIHAVEEVKEQVDKIDMLACCAGIEDFTAVEDIKKNVFDAVFNTNTFGQFKCVSEFHKLMTKGGRIVLTSSVSVRMSVRQHMLYAASKAAIECFVKNVALELGDKGISINAISPGAVATNMAAGNAHKYIPKGVGLYGFASHLALTPKFHYVWASFWGFISAN